MPTTLDLFADLPQSKERRENLSPGAVVLRGFAARHETILVRSIQSVTKRAPLRHMQTPGGFRMSVAMTNCGVLGWVSNTTGYRYTTVDPDSGVAWPVMPEALSALANSAASQAGFEAFLPDACLINHYAPGARLTLHQDKNERDFSAPIVSVSLGLPALFLFGGMKRTDKSQRVPLIHGDVVVWGGPARLRYHGVWALKDGFHPLVGRARINLTFRKAG
jgi:alkylated DNA repair protein (DNA oxidative demethylase)